MGEWGQNCIPVQSILRRALPLTNLDNATLTNLARDIRELRILFTQAINASTAAESEIPEKMRRFVMYFHDIHDMVNIYEERGHQAPVYLKREMERCDDRFRQLMEEQNAAGGTFEKVRREMAADPKNKWDHTLQLPKPTKENQE